MKPEEVKPEDYSVIYYAGGHGTVFDFPDNVQLQKIAAQIYEHGGIVSAVCHGPVGLLNIKLSNGENLIKGKKVTGFSNEEEKMLKLDDKVPHLLEDELKNRGAHFEKGPAFTDFTVSDSRVVTGQNPQSAGSVGTKVLAALHA